MRAFTALMLTAAALVSPAWAATRMLEVDSRLVECSGVARTQCLRVRGVGESDWRTFHGQIENFTFEPGYRYRLEVEEFPVENPPADPFAGKVWRLYELQPRGGVEVLHPGAMITLAIDTPMGKASGKGGCNRWFATAKVHERELVFSGMGATMMACPSPAMDEERAFLDALGRTEGYEVGDDGLALFLSESGLMRFRELTD